MGAIKAVRGAVDRLAVDAVDDWAAAMCRGVTVEADPPQDITERLRSAPCPLGHSTSDGWTTNVRKDG